MPSSSSISGATNVGRIPESTSASIVLECPLRWSTTSSPRWASAIPAATLPCEAPLTRNQVRRAPQASAASCCARSNGVGVGPMSMPHVSAGMSWASASRPITRASPGSAPGPPLWPGMCSRAGCRAAYAAIASRYGRLALAGERISHAEESRMTRR